MRFLVGFTLLFASIALIHGLPVGSQLNNLNAVLTQLPQYQTFLGQLNTILPQLNGVLSATDLQSLKDKITQLVLSQIGNKPNLDALKDQILPLLQQYLASKPQSRVDIDTLLQSIVGAAASALPGMILGLLGKRDVSADGRDLNQLLSLVDKYQLNTLIPQVELFLGPDKLQELQNQFFTTVVTALGSNWNTGTAAQMLQQLLTQFIPQIGQMRIDWDALAQAALNGAASALPGLLIGALGLLGKRDVSADGRDLSQLVALADKFQLTSLIPQVATLLSPEKLQELQKKFLAVILNAATNNWNSATLAQTLQQLVAQFVPQISQMRIDWDSVGQAALNGVVSALPSILIGALGLFGKRSLDVNIQQLLAQLPVNQLAQLVQVVLNSDKTQALSKLKQLLQQFFPNLKGMLNFDDLAAALLNQLNSFLPNISQTIFGNIFG